MARRIEEVTELPYKDGDHGKKFEHPAFGNIALSRVQGGAMLFGSDFRHQHYMTIRINKASLTRDLSRDWSFANGLPYVEVALSEAQWASFVSSAGMGGGTQCTIQQVGEKTIPGLPEPESKKEQFKREASESMSDAIKNISKLVDQINDSSIPKKTKESLISLANMAARDIGSSVDFVMKQFGSHMETTVEKAKIEINAYATNTLMHAGLDAISSGKALELNYVEKQD